MPLIILKGHQNEYSFNVVESNYNNLPSYGGIYIAVTADKNGLNIQDIVAIGSCANFKTYQENIKNFLRDKKCSHLYILPHFEKSSKQFSISDLLTTQAFKNVKSPQVSPTHSKQKHAS